MNRRLAVVIGIVTLSLAGAGWLPTAAATPPPATADEPSCTYTLSTPQLVQVSGTTMVTATLTPYPCTGSISPNSLTVCVTPQHNPTAGQCGFSAVPTKAQVFVAYKPGTTYVTRGTGCGSVYTTDGTICSTVGPDTTTL